MACLHHIYICSFLLAVISGHVFLFSDGRQIKPLKKQKPYYFEDDKGLRIHAKESTGSKLIPAQNKGDHFSGAKEVFPPMSRNGPTPSPEFRTPLTKFANGFQPTTTGKSPGIGHSYIESKEDNKQKSPSNKPNVVHSLQGDINDFRPTGPGRSPGVGHSYRNTKVELKCSPFSSRRHQRSSTHRTRSQPRCWPFLPKHYSGAKCLDNGEVRINL